MRDVLPRRVRLGTFEVDLRCGEVRDGERATVLPEQPFQILRMLVERAGEIVTRDEIQRALWPNDTVVEFDHSINAAINKLRQALGDSAADRNYIETIVRRGYRLLIVPEPVTDGIAVQGGDAAVPSAPAEPPQLSSPPKGTALIGRKVSHYRVGKVIGVGGMGLVYEAEDLKLGRLVALKFLPEDLACDPAALHRFAREARAASSLDHPNICTIYEVEEHEGEPFIVMQLLRGETLRDRLATLHTAQQRLPLSELLNIAVQVCEGLAAAHGKGVIHRDIKPANIFLTMNGPVKVLDFGVAKLMEAGELAEQAMAVAASSDTDSSPVGQLTETGLTMGTAGYMSPEQVRGEELDARSDLFSFGLVLYEMATGQRAFTGATAAVVKDALQNSEPVPLRDCDPALPLSLESIVNRALEKNRELRYQNATEMRSHLLGLIEESQTLGAHKSSKSSRWMLAAAAVLVGVLSIFGVLPYRPWHPTPKLTAEDAIVVGDFDNKTGDPVFDDTLKQVLSTQLSQSPYFNVLSPRRVRETLKQMKRSAAEPLTEELGLEVCQEAGSKAVLSGSIWPLNRGYVLGLKAVDCKTRDVLAEAQEQATEKQDVLRLLDEEAIGIRKKLGEPLSSVHKYASPVAGATSSLEAWKSFSMGLKTSYEHGSTVALPMYKRAAEIDPNFARAYVALSIASANRREFQLSEEYARKAYALREKVSERERLIIEATYYEKVTGELEKAAKAYEVWGQTYPRDMAPYVNLSRIHGSLGNLEQTLDSARETMRREPNANTAYGNLAYAYMILNRLRESEDVFKRAEQHKFSTANLLQNWYLLAFVSEDSSQMLRMRDSGIGKTGEEDVMLATVSDTEAWYGRLGRARKLTQQATDSATHNNSQESAAGYQSEAAVREATVGDLRQAHGNAIAALKLAQNTEIKAMAALALAQAGDTATAEDLANELDNAHPLDTLVQRYWLPTIRAAVAVEKKDPGRAVDLLKDMGTLELSAGNLILYPAYVRAEAYLQQQDGKAAAAEFQKFVDHYGLVANSPWGALARLGLARAYALEAQSDPSARDKARTSYENFLTLWKDADFDIPIYKQAKAEYAKLR